MGRYFRRHSVLHVNGLIGGGGALVPVVTPAVDIVLGQTALAVNAGSSVDVLVTLTRTNYTGTVSLAVGGLPAGVTGAFAPATLAGATLTSVLTLTAAGGAGVVDDDPFTITASGSGVTSSVMNMTLDVNAAPASRSPVAIKGMRHDGLTGNVRATGAIQFPPGAVFATDIANATAWDANGTEVQLGIEDVGARHLSAGVANGLLYAHVQLDTTFAAVGSEPAFTLKFDQPVGRPHFTAGQMQAYTEFTQALDIQIGTDVTKLRLNTDCTCHPYDQNAPIRVLAQDITWASTVTPTIPATGYAVVGVRLMVRTATGQVRAYPKGGATRAAIGNAATSIGGVDYWYHGYGGIENVPGESCIGFAAIHIAAGTAATTVGTSALNGAGVTITATGSGSVPFSTLPTEMPVASLAPSDPTYLCTTQFPGHLLTPEATDPSPFLVSKRRQGSDFAWGRLGWYTYLTNTGSTWYNFALGEWVMYARNAEARYHRRALATAKAFRYMASVTQNNYRGLPEAGADGAQPLVTYALTQRPSDTLNVAAAVEVAAARDVLYRNENAEYRNHSAATPGMYVTGRYGMHVIQAAPWFARLGVDPGAGYVLGTSGTLANDTNGWANGSSWVTVSTAQAHFARMCDRMHTSMRTDAAFSPGMRYLAQTAYDDYGCFMEGWTWSYMALALRAFGVPTATPGGAPSTIAQDMSDSVEYAFTGLSKYTGDAYYTALASGARALVYSTPGGTGATATSFGTLASGLAAYNDTSWALSLTPTPTSGIVRVTSGGTSSTYRFTGRTGSTLTGLTYLSGPQVTRPSGATVLQVTGNGPAAVNLNGVWFMALAYLYQTTAGATSTLWKTRGTALYTGLQDPSLGLYYHSKELSEGDLVGSCWNAESV